jgi:hypothetical protein
MADHRRMFEDGRHARTLAETFGCTVGVQLERVGEERCGRAIHRSDGRIHGQADRCRPRGGAAVSAYGTIASHDDAQAEGSGECHPQEQ